MIDRPAFDTLLRRVDALRRELELLRRDLLRAMAVIQGGGAGAFAEDEALAGSLQRALGAEYSVIYPHMPNEEDPQYEPWAAQIAAELAALADDAIIVGHSVGGAVLLRHLSEAKVDKPLAGLFVVAAPYWGAEEYRADLPAEPPVFLYHGRDDEIVPFAHLAQFAQKFPQAAVREVDGCGHQFNNDLAVVAQDIMGLAHWPARWTGEPYAYLTTIGRRTGRPHRIEIWFAVHDGCLYLLAGGREQSDWVRNLQANAHVTIELGDETHAGVAQVLQPGTLEDRRARELLVGKYREGDNLDGWGRTALPVVITFAADDEGLHNVA